MTAELATLESNIKLLEEALATLFERIKPVLSPRPGDTLPVPARPELVTPIASQISESSHRISRIAEDVIATLHSIEL